MTDTKDRYTQQRPVLSGLYRSRQGKALGVVQGISDYSGISVKKLRLVIIVLTVLSGFWLGVLVYLLAALVMKTEPLLPVSSLAEKEFYDSYSSSRTQGIARISEKFTALEKRIRRMEHIATSKEYAWDRRIQEKG